ncbi:MAG: polysaccharide biosynthesis protein [Planctomycetota bacterium]
MSRIAICRTERDSEDPRALLVGTSETVRTLVRLLDGLPAGSVEALGAVMLDRTDADPGDEADIPVLGCVEQLGTFLDRFEATRVIASLPRAMAELISEIERSCRDHNAELRLVPPALELIRGSAGTGGAPLDLQALVGRAPRALDESRVRDLVRGRRVLITGAGGSIGSELARQCARFEPARIVLVERAENALFEIDRELQALMPGVERRAILHDVAEYETTLDHFENQRPEVVFHAAAHKHVPLMESHPSAAIRNNLFGTKAAADGALACGCERFVLISTDKAVRPSSVMGASKRAAEVYVRSLNARGETRFGLVRFGNVLGSACSVLPIWSKQIARGGPVTITHKDMTRFFMTIPEAASLVAQAATLTGTSGEVFVLDMHEPVAIKDLCARFIAQHGLRPRWEDGTLASAHDDASALPSIRVVFTGIRPGEKLHEVLETHDEPLAATEVPGVLASRGVPVRGAHVWEMVDRLGRVHARMSDDAVVREMRACIPGYEDRKEESAAHAA